MEVEYNDTEPEEDTAGDIKMTMMDKKIADGEITVESGDDTQNNGQAKSESDVVPV